MRILAASLIVLATAAASPILPVPPIPPRHPPNAQFAPMPDPNLRAPLSNADRGTQVGISDFRLRGFDQSLGYSPGSHYQSSEEKRPIQTPGLTVRVPLQ